MILLDISNGWKTAIMVVALIAVFYLFMIRPQSQKAKKEAAYRDSLQKGDRLMTAGGIHVSFVSREGACRLRRGSRCRRGGSGQWPVVSGQWPVVSGQWSVKELSPILGILIKNLENLLRFPSFLCIFAAANSILNFEF